VVAMKRFLSTDRALGFTATFYIVFYF